MKRNLTYFLLVAMTSFWAGCSSTSPTEEGDEIAAGGDEIPELDAGTDAVPGGDLEKLDGDLSLEAPAEGADATLDAAAPAEGAPAEGGDALADASLDAPVDGAPAADPAMALAEPPADAPPAEEPASTDTSATEVAAAAPPESSEPAPVDAAPAADSSGSATRGAESYTVQRGDTLMKIAFETYGDLYEWKKIYEMNRDKLTNPNSIPPGTVLSLEAPANPVSIDRNGDKFMIRPGDTLGIISEDIYGSPSKWKKLWQNNRQLIKDPNKIFAGFYLYYTLSPQERDESDRLKQMRETAPQPLAEAPASTPETGMESAAAGGAMPAAGPDQARGPASATPGGT